MLFGASQDLMRGKQLFSNAAVVSVMAAIFVCASTTASGCSRYAPFSFDELFVADAIVRATAEKYVKEPDPSKRTTGPAEAEVEFKIEEILRGKNLPKTIILSGYLSGRNDYNDMPVPYTLVRKNGRSGSCFANTYRRGGQFLLFLRKTENGYTPNISPLGPSNEQLRGSEDPWLWWARVEISNRDTD